VSPAHSPPCSQSSSGRFVEATGLRRTLNNNSRVAKKEVSDEVVRRLSQRARFSGVLPLVAGARGRIVFETGDLDAGIWIASLAQALIREIPTVNELIDTVVSEAVSTVSKRLSGLVELTGSRVR
jgi:NADH:quinone reductase (non-electrogenic)